VRWFAAAVALISTALAGWLVGSSQRDAGGGGTLHQAIRQRSAAASPAASASSGQGDDKAALPLAGKVVVLDPGHNVTNYRHTAEINKLVNIGTAGKACDTTGTATDSGYAEAEYTLDVSRRARAILVKLGAVVKLTQNGDRAFGPCIDERARIGNEAHADAVVSVHADGSAVGNRGFHVIMPAAVHQGIADTRAIVAPSRRLGIALKAHFAAMTGSAPSNYIGGGTGLKVRNDLGGLNLSTVPKVFIECGNMRDPQDAAHVTDAKWRQRAAQGIADGITAFLEGRG